MKRLLLIVLAVIVGLSPLLAFPVEVRASDTLYGYFNGSADGQPTIDNDVWRGEAFTPSVTHKITSVKFYVRWNVSSADFVFKIYLTDGSHKATGSALYSHTFGWTGLQNETYGTLEEVSFTDGITLSAGTEYCLVLGGINGYGGGGGVASNGYQNGGLGSYTYNGGSSWSNAGDISFYEYGTLPHTNPEVETTSATHITESTVRLTGNLTTHGSDAGTVIVDFEYGTTTAYGSNSEWLAKSGTGSYYVDLTGLDSDTFYHFRARATDSVVTVYGSDLYFTTAYGVTSIVTADAASIHATSAYLGGIVLDMGTDVSVNATVVYGLTDSYGAETAITSMNTTGLYGYYSKEVTGLAENTIYHFKAKMVGENIGTVYGADNTFQTLSTSNDFIAPTVTIAAVSYLTNQGAGLVGEVTNMGTDLLGNGMVLVGFQISTDSAFVTNWFEGYQTLTTTGNFTLNLTGLHAGTQYWARAWARGDISTNSEKITFTTLSNDADGPTFVLGSPYNITDTSVVLSANCTSFGDAGSVTVQYEVSSNETAFSGGDANLIIRGVGIWLTTPENCDLEINNLKPGTRYWWRFLYIYHQEVFYLSAPSPGYFDTTGSAPSGNNYPTVVTGAVTILSSHSAVLNGQITDIGASTSVTPHFLLGHPGTFDNQVSYALPAMVTTGNFTGLVTGLLPGTLYSYRATALGLALGYGSDVTFTTLTLAEDHPMIQTNPATKITGNSATLNAVLSSLGAEATSVECGFEINPQATGTGPTGPVYNNLAGVYFKLKNNPTGPGAIQMAISHLPKNTRYRFRAVVKYQTDVYNGDYLYFWTLPNGDIVTWPPQQGGDNSGGGGDDGGVPAVTGAPEKGVDFLGEHGWGSQGAHWLITIALMVVIAALALIFIPGKTAKGVFAVIGPMCVLGAAIALKFLDIWLVLVLGIVAAFLIAALVVGVISGRRQSA